MSKACDFCGLYESKATVTRRGRAGSKPLRLCPRCVDLHQFAHAADALESALQSPPCFMCAGPSEGEATCQDSHGRFLGRVRICRRCTPDADRLPTSTLWTPGVLELPPPAQRLVPAPPRGPQEGTGRN